jgi:hypothetical protein
MIYTHALSVVAVVAVNRRSFRSKDSEPLYVYNGTNTVRDVCE